MAKYGQFKYGTMKYGEDSFLFITDRNALDISLKTKKAYINVDDLNRLNKIITCLYDDLRTMGYRTFIETKEDWKITDWPTISLMAQMLKNIQNLILCFTVYDTTPMLPETFDRIDYNGMNAVEQNLKDMHELTRNVKREYHYTGDFICGGF